MNHASPRPPGTSAKPRRGSWVQVERQAHIEWAALIRTRPKAASLLHHLVALMDRHNAVVVSQKVLMRLMGVSESTVRRSITDLAEGNWIQVVRLGKGREAAYVINDRVAWANKRSKLNTSSFSATVYADIEDQDADTLSAKELKKISSILPPDFPYHDS